MIKININKEKILAIIKKSIFFIIIFILFFIFIKLIYFKNDFFIAGSDSSWFINPFFLNRHFVWSNYNLGNFYQINDLIPLDLFYGFFLNFNFKLNTIQVIYYTCFYYFSWLTFFYIIKKIFPTLKKSIIFLASFFYIFNAFNLASPFQDRLFPVFIFLPLIFYFYYKLLHTNKKKYLLLFAIISILYSGSNINIAVVSIIYIILFFYLLYFLITQKLNKQMIFKIIRNHLLLILVFLCINFWWIITLVPSMLNVSDIGSKTNAFRATGSGFLYDHFRLIGQWGWYSGYYLSKYFPFSINYYKPLLLVSTYFVTIFSLLIILKIKKKEYFESNERKLYIFFFLLFVFGLFLANGTKYEIGKIYEFIYNSNSLFWMFREPWAKFTPIIVFSLPILLCGTLNYFQQRIKKETIFNILYSIVFISIAINAYPFFTGEIVWKKWNGSMRTNLTKIPNYYNDIRNYLNKTNLEQKNIVILPYNFTYMAFNWIDGFNAGFNPAMILLKNHTITSTNSPTYSNDFAINQIFNNLQNDNLNLKRYISLLNTEYILQENDADWRYSENIMLKPSESNKYITDNNFEKIAEFGKFTKEYLAQIPNEEPDKTLHDELEKELLNQPALILYKNKDSNTYLQHFYIPQAIIKTSQNISVLTDIVSQKDYNIRSATYFSDHTYNADDKSVFDPNSISKTEIKNTPTIEFKKINSTKYKVAIHGATSEFPLIFSESFHDDWKTYLTNYTKPSISLNNSDYKILGGNVDDQASVDELKSYAEKGFISSLGDLKNKNIKHVKWENNKEVFDYNEPYKIGFISKNFNGTIQNDNLEKGNFYETWLQKPIDDNKNHSIVNGYANSWDINPAIICLNNSKCIKNTDGSYDMELVIEFWPQRLFYIGLFISGTTLIGCITYLIIDGVKNRKKKSSFTEASDDKEN